MFYVYRNVANIGSVLQNVVTRHHYSQRIDIVSDDSPDPILVVKIGGDIDVTYIDR